MRKHAIVFWFTGLSGSGKSTIANKFAEKISAMGKSVKILDGDDIRKDCHINLGFSQDDIKKNNELIAELCCSFLNQVDIVLVSVIAPFVEARLKSREIIGRNYIEVFVKASLDTVIKRDVKGLYKQALAKEIDNFIGIDPKTPYEIPENPDITLDTEKKSLDEVVEELISFYKYNHLYRGGK